MILLLFINPFYVLIFGVFVERKNSLGKYLNYLIAISIALSISNRPIGNSWYSESGVKGDDDAINYIAYYSELKNESYILQFDKYVENFTDGKEPLWFSMSEMIGVFSGFNIRVLVFLCVLIPLLIIHYSLLKISSFFCLSSLLFYSLVPETFHTLYHLWRFALASSIINVVFVKLIVSKKINYKLLVIGILGHVTSVLMVMSLIFSQINFTTSAQIRKIRIVFVIFLKLSIITFITWLLLTNVSFDKILFYLDGEVDLNFKYSIRHYIYYLLSFFLLWKSRNEYILFFSFLNIFLLSIPLVFPAVGIFLERILIISTPLIPLMLAYHLSVHNKLRLHFSLFSVFLFIYFSFKLDNTLFYQYISSGNFFKLKNGLLYNLLTYPI